MNIHISFVPKAEMRYDTLGDWEMEDGDLFINVAEESGDEDDQILIAMHELVEAILCRKHGMTQEQVDTFDMGPIMLSYGQEPGDHPDAPYRTEHRQAMLIEHLLANFMGKTDYGVIK